MSVLSSRSFSVNSVKLETSTMQIFGDFFLAQGVQFHQGVQAHAEALGIIDVGFLVLVVLHVGFVKIFRVGLLSWSGWLCS